MTKRAIAALLLAALALPAAAQRPDQETLKQKKEAKLDEAWLKDGGWLTDYDKALAEAKKSDKPIFAYFTRSYAY